MHVAFQNISSGQQTPLAFHSDPKKGTGQLLLPICLVKINKAEGQTL